MKTALEKLKENLSTQKEFYGREYPQLLNWINELIEYEKEIIETAFEAGMNNSEDYYIPYSSGEKSMPECENYYKQTFKNN